VILICLMGARWSHTGGGSAHHAALPPWSYACTLHPPRLEPGGFGAAVALSEGRLWIGPSRDADLGEGPPQVWALGLAAGEPGCERGPPIAIVHPQGDRHAAFGAAISACGDGALIGAPAAGCRNRSLGCGAGEAWLAHVGTSQPVRLEPLFPLGSTVHAEAGAGFGSAVALSERWAIVASPRADSGHFDSGAVDIFDRADHLRHRIRLLPSQPGLSGWFGASLTLQEDWLAVGEPGAASNTHATGCVHMFHFTLGAWRLHSSWRAPASANGWYGATVALAGEVLLVGSPLGQGAVTQLELKDDTWRLVRVVSPERGAAGFGIALAADSRTATAIIGSSADGFAAPFGGTAWSMDLLCGRLQRLPCPAPSEDQGLGAGVALRGAVAAVASGGDPELSPPAPGLVHILGRCHHSWVTTPGSH
jgi:hypothetical protein